MFVEQKKLSNPMQYKKQISLNGELLERKREFDSQIAENLHTRDKFVVVCGPCSADNPEAMCEYLHKLKAVADRCPDLLVVARVYSSKPHSDGQGYKGTAFHLNCGDEVDLNGGIIRCREMMRECLEIGLPIADELLYPELYECFDDLVSYWFLGARSSENTLHRCLASGLDVCCGVKNSTDGDLIKVVDSLFAVSNPCVFPYNGSQIATNGCKNAHIVLRGGLAQKKYFSNISKQDVMYVRNLLKQRGLNDFVMADLNHANSEKVALNQIKNAEIAFVSGVDGVMIESYLNGGGQSSEYGTSQTDDCLGFETTVTILEYLQRQLYKMKN
ncbi:MAG: 3-deoxy-7-phosphoheptulonate synthase [Clostridiales bacterium]|nr:3-deoxy-7-phosphoheptulonate synthase [Clostridiales bacterium]